MSYPEQQFPVNELEEVLAAAVGRPEAGARLLEVVGRSHLWVPLPEGGGPQSGTLDLPTTEIGGQAYVPVFSSKEEFLKVVGSPMSFTVAPAREFARGLPPELGIALNPGGAIGVPLPPEAVAELCREPLAGGGGGRVRLSEPDWQEDPVEFLRRAGDEFHASGAVLSARRALASVEGAPPQLYVGVQLTEASDQAQQAAVDALGRALGAHPVPWPVQMVFLDAVADPVVTWMADRVRPFFARA
ncbi:enhanced serine sensitivity protein SseB [Streptomyces boninensis]|uniref:enhanced serine sensitivity protein SseB n=1 Tax=Streptomyces boninensis TaxID=2039455 RepID=UPI003B220B4C